MCERKPHVELIDCFLRMVRIIVVIDVELQKPEWNLRKEAMVLILKNLRAGKHTLGKFQIKETHMHGLRLVFKNKEDLEETLKKSENVPDEESDKEFDCETHSDSDYASIFFAQWPVTLLDRLP